MTPTIFFIKFQPIKIQGMDKPEPINDDIKKFMITVQPQSLKGTKKKNRVPLPLINATDFQL